jgi:DnaJ-class molecular chaperone
MFEELLKQANGFFDAAIEGPLADNIAKFSRQQHEAFLRQGFTIDQSIQFVAAILGKKA